MATPSGPQTTARHPWQRLGAQLGGSRGNRRIPVGPVVASPGEQPHRLAVAADDQSIAVVLDLMHPAGGGGRLGGKGGDAGVNEPVGTNRNHAVDTGSSVPRGTVRVSRNCHAHTTMPGKRVQFDQETWNALDLLARESMWDFQELADEAFADLLRKHAGRSTSKPPCGRVWARSRSARRRHRCGCAMHRGRRDASEGPSMGVRTRGLDMKAGFKRDAADKAARAEAEAVVQRWNDQLALGRGMPWSPTIRAALLAGMARRLLSRLRDKPHNQSPHPRPPSPRLGRHAGARPAMLVVPRHCADA